MSRIDCAYYRKRALARRKKPGQDAENDAAAEAIRKRVSAQLAGMPQIQALNAAALGVTQNAAMPTLPVTGV